MIKDILLMANVALLSFLVIWAIYSAWWMQQVANTLVKNGLWHKVEARTLRSPTNDGRA